MCLTPGVQLSEEPLTIQRLTEQFEAARDCNEPLHRSPAKQPYGVDIAGTCERSIKIAQAKGEMDDKPADQRRSRVKTFCLLTGIQTVTEVEQYHLRIFEERIEDLRKNFLKRRDDAFLTWADIETEAQELEDEQLGRAASTYNSYLDQIGAVLKHARANERSAVGADRCYAGGRMCAPAASAPLSSLTRSTRSSSNRSGRAAAVTRGGTSTAIKSSKTDCFSCH